MAVTVIDKLEIKNNSSLPVVTASRVEVTATGFSGNLSSSDTDVQTALATIDALSIGGTYTDENAQDAVGTILADSSSIDFTYTDATPSITAVVLPAGVDHNSLSNFDANKHIDHTSVSISAGTGLTGGGTIAASRTLTLADTAVTPATYGSTTAVGSFTVDQQGRLTAASSITITPSNIGAQPVDTTLTALAAYNTNGILTQTAADTFTGRTITGTASRLTVTNGDGGSGNPTLDISSSYVGQSSITTLGTITTGVWNGTDIAYANIQDVSATDKLLGRSTAGAGVIEEITCTSFGRSLIDDADASTARSTLGLGTLATQSGTFSGTSSGTNTGDQTITLTGDVTGSGTGSFAATIANDAVTYAKIQNVSATDKLLGRSTAGAGDIEEITCTSFARSMLDDAAASDVRTTLGLGTLATQSGTFSGTSSGTNTGDQTITLTGDVTGSGTGSFAATIANDAVTYAKIQNVSATDKLLGRSTAGAGDVEEITCTSFARSILDDAAASDVRTTLGLGTLATQSGTFSGTSSGTNTGDQTITLTGDVTGSGTGSFAATIASGAVSLAKMANVATATVFYRKTASAGSPEVQTLATLKTDLGLTGTNSGDQTITLTGDVTGSGTGSFAATIANDAVTYAKIQNVSATDKILGRSTAGAGDVEEISCTAAGRALIDDASASDQRNTLGLGTLATQSGTFSGTSSGTNTGDQTITLTGDVTGSGTGTFAATIANDAVTYAKMQNVSATDKLLGRSTAGAGDVEEITCTPFARSMLDDAAASDVRTTLGLGTLATQSGTFSGTSSGTNTGDQTISLTGDVTGSGTGSFSATIANDAVTYAKIQNVSATDKILGRSTAGAGDVEEITCTAAGRALIDDADAASQRTTLGLGTAALSATGDFEAAGSIATHAAVTSSVHGISAFGATLVDDADAATARTTLGLGSFATLSTLAHSSTTGLTSGDDHTQYALLAGRATGQTIIGGTASGDDLTLKSTSHGTKGDIIFGTGSAFQETTNMLGLGSTSPASVLHITGNQSSTYWNVFGLGLRIDAATYTNTSSSGTVTNTCNNYIGASTIAASNTVTFTNSASLYLAGAPVAGTNTTLTNAHALWVDSGTTRLDGFVGIGLTTGTPISDLEISSAAAIDGTDPTTLTIRSTRNSSSWTVGARWGSIDFYTDDLSNPGVLSRISAMASNTAGSACDLVFYTNSAEAFRFTSNQYAQIGGSTAAAALAVTSVSTAPTLIRVDAPASHANHAIDVVNNGTRFFTCTSGLTVNVGTQTTASSKFHVIATTEQCRFGYDASNYYTTTVGSTGTVTLDAVGSGAGFTFSDSITLADAKDLIVNTTTGTKIGTATTQKLGFYNATPIVQRSGAAQAAVTTTAATNVAPYGYSTAAQADAIITLVNELRAWAVAQGFIKGSA